MQFYKVPANYLAKATSTRSENIIFNELVFFSYTT
jgi:hypothetical protein